MGCGGFGSWWSDQPQRMGRDSTSAPKLSHVADDVSGLTYQIHVREALQFFLFETPLLVNRGLQVD